MRKHAFSSMIFVVALCLLLCGCAFELDLPGEMGEDLLLTDSDATVTLSIIGFEDEVILAPSQYKINRDETAYEMLVRIAAYEGITVNASNFYVQGIGGLNEGDKGPMHGWGFKLNGEVLMISASEAVLSDGDVLTWEYLDFETLFGL